MTAPTRSSAAAPAPVQAPDRLDPALIKLTAILMVGAIAALLDTTIVNVGLDAIARDLHTTVSTGQWVMTGYLLSFGMVIPLNGWAIGRFGARATWLASLALFLAGSVACGLAWNIGSLVAFRVIQGIGGGMLMPVLTTLLIRAAGGRSLGRRMATVSLPAVVVPVAGPIVGGLIVSNLSWRWLFYVNVPICLAGLFLAWRGLAASPAARATARPRLDLIGLALLSPGLAAVLYGLAQVSVHHGFGHLAVVIPLVAGLAMYGALLLIPLYYQQVRGASALTAGLLLVPQGVGSLLPRTIAGKLTDRIGPRPVILTGMALAALGTLPFALAGAHTSEVLLSAGLVLRGAGLAGATIAVMATAFTGLAPAQVPHASSATRILQQVGGSFGTAVLIVILELQLASGHGAAAGAGLATAFGHTFWWAIGFTVVGALPAPLLRRAARAI